MKTVISNKSGEVLEVAKQWIYSLQVLLVGLFIPFLFVFGISYKMPKVKAETGISISKQNVVTPQSNLVDLGNVSPEKNS
jgi:hypothetical protein